MLHDRISSSFNGFHQLVKLYYDLLDGEKKQCKIDFSYVNWFDANMCASLGAVMYSFHTDKWLTGLSRLKPKIEEIFQKNAFLQNFGSDQPPVLDTHGTTIEYQRFDRTDSKAFKEYIEKHFVRKEIPEMSEKLHKKFRESIAEIFENCIGHSETDLGIFVCGQFFPKKERLDFSIVDRGIGFRKRILKTLNEDYSSIDAIRWGLKRTNTTRLRKDGKPGGKGLKLIKDFIELNNGKLIIVSDEGYVELGQNSTIREKFSKPFPGTAVTIEINTADTKSYRLATEEVDPHQIF